LTTLVDKTYTTSLLTWEINWVRLQLDEGRFESVTSSRRPCIIGSTHTI